MFCWHLQLQRKYATKEAAADSYAQIKKAWSVIVRGRLDWLDMAATGLQGAKFKRTASVAGQIPQS